MVEGPGVQPIRACLERNAQCYKGSLQVAGRKKPLRHLIGVSEEFAASGTLSGTDRTLLADSQALFVWASLAQIHGIPGIAEWADWFQAQLERHKAVIPALGIGCNPVLIKGDKEQFLWWLSDGLWIGSIQLPAETGPIRWPSLDLRRTFFPDEVETHPSCFSGTP